MLYHVNDYKLKAKDGADAQFSFRYELRKKSFFFNFGANAQYAYTRMGMKEWTDFDPSATDFTGDNRVVGYHYSKFLEQQTTVSVSVPIQFGVYFTPKFYAAVGVKAFMPLIRQYSTKSGLMTDGSYDFYFVPLEEDDRYRYYPTSLITRSGSYQANDNQQIFVSPTLEMGTVFNVAPRVSLRLGGYVEYSIPVIKPSHLDYPTMIEYGEMDYTSPTLTFEEFTAPISIHSSLDNPTLAGLSKLAVGVKFTVLFNVTPQHICFTCDDETGHRYIQPKRIRRMGSTAIHTSTNKSAKHRKGDTKVERANIQF